MVSVSDAADHQDHDHTVPHGTDRLPRDLTDAQLDAAPVLASIDALLVDDLTDAEDDAFAAALTT
jgi:hypothetical protein